MWLLLALGPLLFFQRALHRQIQIVLLLLTRRMDLSTLVFALLFLPGVALHELSHYLMARLLQVRTGRLSLLPRPMPNGKLQLGYVETAPADMVRDSLIGAAPLLTGGLFVTYAGLERLGLRVIWERLAADPTPNALSGVNVMMAQPDFWLWFYLVFCVSSVMLPSASDRRQWLSLGLILGALLALALVAGGGGLVLAYLAPLLNQALLALAQALGISLGLHAILLLPVWFVRRLLERLTGLRAQG